MTVCPTNAITAPGRLDARRCISYLTIEHKGAIPEPLREAIGNRIFGCDDCQIVCPWNRFARRSEETEFAPRHGLDQARIATLLGWDEATFHARTVGMAVRRVSYQQWLRNLAVAAGNAPLDPAIVAGLRQRRPSAPEMGARAHRLGTGASARGRPLTRSSSFTSKGRKSRSTHSSRDNVRQGYCPIAKRCSIACAPISGSSRFWPRQSVSCGT